jgi:Protein of unknown function (DUF1579)
MRPSNTLRITLRFALLTGLGLLGAALCLLCETDGKHPETTESSRSGMSADSANSPEMRRLERAFAGTWTISDSFARNEFYPNGAERQGTAQFRLATGGTSLIEEVHSDGSAGRLDFMVVIWWDGEAKVYNFFTCGNRGSNPCKIRGTAHWDGDSLVNDYELSIRGAKNKWKDTFSDISPTSFTLVAAMESSDGNTMQRMITTQYRRK